MLEGQDSDWVLSSAAPYGNYSGLGSGDYILKLSETTQNDNWKDEFTGIRIHVTSPLWRKAWFQLFLLLLGILTSAGIANYIGRLANEVKQRKNAESALTQKEEDLRVILDSIGDGVIATDVAGRILRLNPTAERLTAWKQPEAVGQVLTKVFPLLNLDTRRPLTDPVKQVFSGNPVSINFRETILTGRDRTEKLIDFRGAPIRNGQNEPIGVVLVFQDVTERHAMEERFRQSEKMDAVGRLAGGIAHDFNNMLSGIIGSAELLKNKLNKDPEGYSLLNTLQMAANRAAELTSKLLGFSKSSTSFHQAVNLHEIVDYTITLLEQTLDKPIELMRYYRADSFNVIGNANQIESAILNLGMHASETISDKGVIRFSTENVFLDSEFCHHSSFDIQPGGFVLLTIKDTGQGMDGQTCKRIFEPFYTEKTTGLKTGMELASIYGLMKESGGMVSVESELGQGSSFHLYFKSSQQSVEAPESDQTQKTISGLGTILVVDDERVIRETSGAILKHLGYRVLLAENGVAALSIFKSKGREIDLILLDMIMPVMAGAECLKKLRTLSPDIKVVMSSGYLGETSTEKIQSFNLSGFISKPYHISELGQTIYDALGLGKESPSVESRTNQADGHPCSQKPRILVMDDEEMIRETIARILKRLNCEVDTVVEGQQAIERYTKSRNRGEPYDLVIFDINVKVGIGGEEAGQGLLKLVPETKIIISSGDPAHPVMLNYEEYGFKDCLQKPFRKKDLSAVIEKVLAQ